MIIPVHIKGKELIQWLVKHKAELIQFKKSDYKKADSFSLAILVPAQKSLYTNFKDDAATGVIKRTIIGNTYNWMDSVSDVLCDGCFDKSIKEERQDKVFHLHDHIRAMAAKVGTPTALYEKGVDWQDLGVNKSGRTQCLMMDSDIKKDYNPQIFAQYLAGEVDQHSVGMYYKQLDLAINDPEMKAEYAAWNKYIGKIGNREECEKQGFFWAVKEAHLIEISAVLAGSNELTPTVPNESKMVVDNPKDTSKDFWRNIAASL